MSLRVRRFWQPSRCAACLAALAKAAELAEEGDGLRAYLAALANPPPEPEPEPEPEAEADTVAAAEWRWVRCAGCGELHLAATGNKVVMA